MWSLSNLLSTAVTTDCCERRPLIWSVLSPSSIPLAKPPPSSTRSNWPVPTKTPPRPIRSYRRCSDEPFPFDRPCCLHISHLIAAVDLLRGAGALIHWGFQVFTSFAIDNRTKFVQEKTRETHADGGQRERGQNSGGIRMVVYVYVGEGKHSDTVLRPQQTDLFLLRFRRLMQGSDFTL